MRRYSKLLLLFLGLAFLGWVLWVTIVAPMPTRILRASLERIAEVVQPTGQATPQTLSAGLKIVKADGLSQELAGRTVELAVQGPDHLLLSAELDKARYSIGRDGQELWIYAPAKKFGVIGKSGLPRFASAPEKTDATQLSPFGLPLSRRELLALPLLMKIDGLPAETIDNQRCQVMRVTPRPKAIKKLKIPEGELRLWLRESDHLPARVGYVNRQGVDVLLEFQEVKVGASWPSERWKLTSAPGDSVETVALSQVTRFIPAALSLLTQKVSTLGPAKGERRVLAREGEGRLELINDTKVLFLKGSPEAMGHQHGVLMKPAVRNLVDRILYGVGVGSSFDKGRWFFGEIERAQARLLPFIDPRYVREMDAMAHAAGLAREEVQLANFFPELFHCSGFALWGDATTGGRMYHGRILDYLKGVGLEPNAVVIVHQPEYGHAWVNIGYAGFVGSVTAMNEKHISIGEMGGRGEGLWDGKPMAQLLREVMEKAGTLDEAVDILRQGPRTCEYYYVVADGQSKRAVGIAATPTTFEVVLPGQFHPRLPHPFKDAVLMSAGDRYETLAERVKGGYGKFDANSARRLMERPVAMKSNIHSVLFAPDTLDFWVANADAQNVASHTRYTHYNLAELLITGLP